MAISSSETVIYEEENGVGYIRLNRPQAMNAVNFKMRNELAEIFSRVSNDPVVKVIVLMGAGEKAFSVGADIKEFSTPQAVLGWDRWSTVGISEKPVIASIHGHCLGAAFQLILRCDIRVASRDAQFGLPEINFGVMVSDGGSQRLPRLIGLPKALEIIWTGNSISAQEAYDFGLVNRIADNHEELLTITKKIAESIATKNTKLTRIYKNIVHQGMSMPLEEALQLEHKYACMVRENKL